MFADLPPTPPAQVVCIAQAVYGEARGESEAGKRAVAHVILNRSKKRNLTPCQVIRQPGQFHFKIKQKYSGKDWNKAYQIALNPGLDLTRGALFFHNTSVRPRWNLRYLVTIGRHMFYK